MVLLHIGYISDIHSKHVKVCAAILTKSMMMVLLPMTHK
jgi:hypothetical protein